MADGAEAEATAFVGDLFAKGCAFVSVEAEEAEFHELAGAEKVLEFGEESGREAGLAEFQGGLEGLAEAAQAGFLRAGERQVIHGGEGCGAGADGKVGMGKVAGGRAQVMRRFWQPMRRARATVCLY